eukprot:scaffold5987_cov222-Ochromonas_danica.AAC.2
MLTELIKSCELIESLIIRCCGLESLVAVSKHSSLSVVHLITESVSEEMLDGLLLDEKTHSPKPLNGTIALKDISFAYPSRPDIMVSDRMSLDISHGETVALVGSSGCGKSTIINLLLRFYDPVEGNIALDGHDLFGLDAQELASMSMW